MKNKKQIFLEAVKKEIGDIIQDLNSTTACFIGHRSPKLPWRFHEDDIRCIGMKITLRCEIEKAIQKGYKTFLCGMELGFDMICAETVLDLKKQYQEIMLVGVLSCRSQDIKWSTQNKARYDKILAQLDDVRCIYDDYIGVERMLERNRYMVHNSSLMIALYNGLSGGTKSTIDYARKQGLEIVIIKP